MEYENLPIIKVSFNMSGKKIDFSKINESIGIRADTERGIDDWPDVIKNNNSLPDSLKPRCIWSLLYEKENCKDINILLGELLDQLSGKRTIINDLTLRFSLNKTIEVTIHAYNNEMPYIGLQRALISFLKDIDAEIEFDIYGYDVDQ